MVMTASGAAKAIAALKPGDKVLATNTKTGKTQAETVTAVEVNHDHDLYDLHVKTRSHDTVIHTTASHLFWDPYLHQWRPASKLKKGEHLKTANGVVAAALGGTVPSGSVGWMWDITVPGDNGHDFYVVAGSASILVHNNCDLHDLARAQSAASKSNNTAGAVARDTYTGEWAYGESGMTPARVHPQLQERLDQLLAEHGGSLEEWPAGECAEFNACNNLLWQQPGVYLNEIEYATINRDTGENFPSCENCRFLLVGGGASEAAG